VLYFRRILILEVIDPSSFKESQAVTKERTRTALEVFVASFHHDMTTRGEQHVMDTVE